MKSDQDGNSSEQESRVLSQAVAKELKEGILTGLYQPGTRVRQDDLAERFGISRIPVREALRELESEGLVVLIPNRGAWVAKIDMEECVEIYKIRERIEPLALAESVPLMDQETISELCGLAEKAKTSAEVEDFLKYDREFHLLSFKVAKMPTLYAMIERFWNTTQHYRRAYSQLIGDSGQWIIHHEHRLIMEAIKRRDPRAAEELLYLHIRRTRLQLEASDTTLR